MKLQTSAKDNFPSEQLVFIKWGGGATGAWTPFGKHLQQGQVGRQTSS